MTSLTVFLVGGGERATAVRALAESWTRAGILEPSLWVSAHDVENAEGPPRVTATLVGEQETTRVDLFSHIGRYRLSLVRLVAAHLVLADGEIDPQLVAAARAVAKAVEGNLPRHPDSGDADVARLHRSLVMIPVSGAGEASAGIFEPAWDVNVVISPEDRPDLDRLSDYVRHPGNFDGHAAAAMAAIGGVLRGVGSGVLDDLGADSLSQEASAVVARVSIRTVVGEDVLDALTDRAVSRAEFGTTGPAAVLPWARPAARPDLLVDAALAHLLTKPGWAPVPEHEAADPRRTQQGLGAALGSAAAFNLRTTGAVIGWGLSHGRATVERSATEAIVGADGGALVTLGPRRAEELTSISDKLLRQAEAHADQELRLEAARIGAPAPTMWADLRGLAFALADGGDLRDFPEPRQAGKREILPPHAVVVAPGDTFETPDGIRIPASDPRAMRGHLEQLGKDGPDGDNEPSRRWYQERASSLLWRVGDGVGRRSDELARRRRELRLEAEQHAPPDEELKKAQRRLSGWWGWTLGGGGLRP